MPRDLSAEYVRSLLDYDPETGTFRWRVTRGRFTAGSLAGSPNRKGYRQIKIDGRMYMSSHLAWLLTYGTFPFGQVDHRNLTSSDDRINNLRCCTQSQNKANSRAYRNNRLGLKGVKVMPSGSFQARIRKDGKLHHLGTFSTMEQASAAYAAAASRMFGAFARAA